MCMLTYFPPTVMPDTEALTNGAFFNNDGHGFAIVAGRRIIVRHSMNSDDLIATFVGMRRKHRNGPALFHSRMSTHGTIGTHNCHPFKVGGDRRTVVAHNGILPTESQPGYGDSRSDTRIAAEEILPNPPFNDLDSPYALASLAQWLGPRNKIVILTVDPRYRQRSYLVNEENGTWDNWIWYSSEDYRSLSDYKWYSTMNNRMCEFCLTMDSVDDNRNVCAECGVCVECGEYEDYCACYAPWNLTLPL